MSPNVAKLDRREGCNPPTKEGEEGLAEAQGLVLKDGKLPSRPATCLPVTVPAPRVSHTRSLHWGFSARRMVLHVLIASPSRATSRGTCSECIVVRTQGRSVP